jgi:hypothetical protein
MFKWGDFLAQALTLAAGDEVGHRSAIGRAYYSAFGLARQQLRTEGHSEPVTGQAHGYVWSQFDASADVNRRLIGVTGHRLRRAHNPPDYEDVIAACSALSESSLADATRLAELLRGL